MHGRRLLAASVLAATAFGGAISAVGTAAGATTARAHTATSTSTAVAVSVAVIGTTEYAFWEGANGALWDATQTSTGSWTGVTAASPGFGPLGSEPSAVAVGSNIYVFWEGTNSALWWAEWTPGTSTWTAAASPGDGPLGSAPEATYNTHTSAIDIFWKGADNNLWGATDTPGTTAVWTGPTYYGYGPLGSAPTAGSDSVGDVYVYWQGSGNNTHVWEAWYNATATTPAWSGPIDLGAWTGNTGSLPTTAVTQSGNQYLFWEGMDSSLYEAAWSSSTGWVGFTGRGYGPLNSAPAAGVSTTAVPSGSSATGTLYIQWQGTDLNMWGATVNFATSVWTGPTFAGFGPLT